MRVGEVGYGFTQGGFNRPWGVAQLTLCPLGREGCGPQCDTDGFCRGGRRSARYVIGHEFHHSSSCLGKPPRNGNAKATSAADCVHIVEKLFERNAFTAENVPLANLSAFHGKQ